MSTWHQRQNPVPLWHEELWTVVTDGYDSQTTVCGRYRDPVQAQREAEKQGGYVIPPARSAARAKT